MQGLGWTCLEELVWGDAEHKWLPPGVLHTRGPGAPACRPPAMRNSSPRLLSDGLHCTVC